ncbi:MAG: DNA gyrase C-terminal beta-propeller domain-containing protein, partial [Rhodothermales bacterium]|nr:DNA gyrase C-terminal beta-propeller domain-containing protein [Rhodothermales bacterium]
LPSQLTKQQLERLGLPTEGKPLFSLTEAQAKAILDMRLSRLTGLERQKVEDEYRDILQQIERFKSILANEGLRMQIIKEELTEVKEKYADPRRTEIDYTGGEDIIVEDLVEDDQMVVTISWQGLIKRTSVTEYRKQGRGGVGMRGSGMREEDYIEHLFVSYNHDYLLFFTDHGLCYWLRVYEIPEGTRTAKGRSIRNLIQISPEDRIRAVVSIDKERFRDEEFLESHYIFMSTRGGKVKKTQLSAFSRPRVDGIIAISVVEGDQLLEAKVTDGSANIILASSAGLSIRFDEEDVRPMGRNTQGVRGISLKKGEEAIGMIVVRGDDPQKKVLSISANGYGKRTDVDEYRLQGRGGKGIITQKTTSRTGAVVGIKAVLDSDDLMIVTHNGLLIRMHVAGISTLGRNTQGVRLIKMKPGDSIADVTRLVIEDEDEEAEDPDIAESSTNGEDDSD